MGSFAGVWLLAQLAPVRACGSRRFHLPLSAGVALLAVLNGARAGHPGE